MYSCANPSAGCRTIDRGETLRALSNVYSSQLKQLSSLMSSKQARSAGVRSKLQPLVVKAKALKAQGESSLAQCPRFDKECRYRSRQRTASRPGLAGCRLSERHGEP
ncbi:MAG: hypothetical protein ACK56I_07090, partial [bacterium]